jgi:hypothetical protein
MTSYRVRVDWDAQTFSEEPCFPQSACVVDNKGLLYGLIPVEAAHGLHVNVYHYETLCFDSQKHPYVHASSFVYSPNQQVGKHAIIMAMVLLCPATKRVGVVSFSPYSIEGIPHLARVNGMKRQVMPLVRTLREGADEKATIMCYCAHADDTFSTEALDDPLCEIPGSSCF